MSVTRYAKIRMCDQAWENTEAGKSRNVTPGTMQHDLKKIQQINKYLQNLQIQSCWLTLNKFFFSWPKWKVTPQLQVNFS